MQLFHQISYNPGRFFKSSLVGQALSCANGLVDVASKSRNFDCISLRAVLITDVWESKILYVNIY